jgi:hypothetical protein
MVPVAASAWLAAALATLFPESAGATALACWGGRGSSRRRRRDDGGNARTWCALGAVILAAAAAVGTHVALAQPARDDVARARWRAVVSSPPRCGPSARSNPAPTDGVSTACSTASSAGTTRTVRRLSPASPSSCGRRSDRLARPRRPRHDHRHRVAHRPGRARRPRHRRERRAPRGRAGGRALAVAAALRLGLADVSSGSPRRGRLIADSPSATRAA